MPIINLLLDSANPRFDGNGIVGLSTRSGLRVSLGNVIKQIYDE